MNIKIVRLGEPARALLRRGVNVLADAVVVTLGPRGRTVLLDEKYGPPTATKDGVAVAKRIRPENPFENMGVDIVREAALKASERAGDGTTTAIVLARELINEGFRLVAAGHDAMSIRRGIDRGVEAVIGRLREISRAPSTKEELARVAALSANRDEELGRLIADAIDEVGPDGVIAVEQGRGIETKLEIVKGMDFDRGLLSPAFATDGVRTVAELKDCLVFLSAKKLTSVVELLPLLDYVQEKRSPLLVIAEDVDREVLSLLVENHRQRVIRCAAVKAPGVPSQRWELLEDIAAVTDGTVFSEERGIRLADLTAVHLGRAGSVRIDLHNTTITEGAGRREDIAHRAQIVRREIDKARDDFEREKLEERLAKLVSGVAIVRVGGTTEIDMKDRQARAENAAEAAKAALKEGVVPGGGVALIRAAQVLDTLEVPADEAVGLQALRKALHAPLFWIARNAGANAPVVVEKVRSARKRTIGYNAVSGEVEDLFEAGVIDPTSVVRIALESAASATSGLLAIETAIIDHPNPPEKDYLDPPVPDRWK